MKRLLLLTAILLSPLSYAEETFNCMDEMAVGTWFDKIYDKWRVSEFQEKRRTIKFSDDRSSVEGLYARTLSCAPHYITTSHHLLTCNDPKYPEAQLLINMDTLRYEFIKMSPYGYQDDQSLDLADRELDTSTVYAGTCERV